MRTGHKPQQPRCPLGEIQPLPVDAEEIKREAWRAEGILVISRHDVRLGWDEAMYLKQIGDRVYDTK